MKLEQEHENVLRGEDGEAMALAMKTLVAYGEAFGAKRLVPIKSAHLTGSFGISPFSAYYQILGRLADEGAKFKVPTTLNPRPGRDLNIINRLIFGRQKRLESCYSALGITPNYSCVCYFNANVPALGDRIAWAESSAVQYANSALGARTNRNSILIDVCGAVTGLTPEFGYLLDENRRGRVLVRIKIDRMDPPALGYIIGKTVVDRVPVIEHYPFSREELKNMGGAMAASGGVALFHVEGVTPEAPDMKTVFDGSPKETITITQADLDAMRSKNTEKIRHVIFGCPQMTADEAAALAERFAGKKTALPVWFCMIPDEMKQFEQTGLFRKAREAGVQVYDHCPLASLPVRKKSHTVLTNSGKLYYYLENTEYGATDDCLRACGVL
ncbi:MAG: aconitase X catalytic domain-containing protein [bacterium]